MPLRRTWEVVLGGWRPGRGRRAGTLGALLVGVYDEQVAGAAFRGLREDAAPWSVRRDTT